MTKKFEFFYTESFFSCIEKIQAWRRVDGGFFDRDFLDTYQPFLWEVVNQIIQANINWVKATNYHESPMFGNDDLNFLNVFLNPHICDSIEGKSFQSGFHYFSLNFPCILKMILMRIQMIQQLGICLKRSHQLSQNIFNFIKKEKVMKWS